MDARIDVHRILGLEPGDAHVIRNAGGTVTEDVLGSLLVSQHVLGTREVMLIHHTGCGMLGLDEDALKARCRERNGRGPPGRSCRGSRISRRTSVHSIKRIQDAAFLSFDSVRGFVYDVTTGLLSEPRS